MTFSIALIFALALLQSTPGSLVITVYDAEGATLPGTLISLTGPTQRRSVADANGSADFIQLPPGRYQLTTTLAGFADYSASVEVAASAQTRHHVVMKFVGHFDSRRGRYVAYQMVTGCDLPPPATLEEFWASVVVVARVRVEGQRPALRGPGGASSQRVVTLNSLRALEVFKSQGSWPDTSTLLEVTQDGGEVDRGDYIQVTSQPAFPLLQIGREYVLFLRQNGVSRDWFVAFCAEGALARDADSVEAGGWSDFSRTWHGKRWETLVDALRKMQPLRP